MNSLGCCPYEFVSAPMHCSSKLFNDDDDRIDDQHQYELPNATHYRMCVAVGTTCIVEINYTYIYQCYSKYGNLMKYTTNPKLSHFVTIFYSKNILKNSILKLIEDPN
jgi:hypothetical protein